MKLCLETIQLMSLSSSIWTKKLPIPIRQLKLIGKVPKRSLTLIEVCNLRAIAAKPARGLHTVVVVAAEAEAEGEAIREEEVGAGITMGIEETRRSAARNGGVQTLQFLKPLWTN